MLFSGSFRGYTVALLEDGFSYHFWRPENLSDDFRNDGISMGFHRIDVRYPKHSRPISVTASAPRHRNTHYGHNGTSIGTEEVDTVTYHGIMGGADIRFISTGGHFKYDIVCQGPEALRELALQFEGPLGPLVPGPDGGVTFTTSFGKVTERIPASYFVQGSRIRSTVVIPMISDDGASLGFDLKGGWPEGHSLVIDPEPHLLWSTYVGGSGMDELHQVDVDALGNIYVSGFTTSLANIATTGAHQGTLIGFQNCFLMKYSPQGQKLFGTYFGGQSADRCYGMTRDENTGNVYLSGSTFSSGIATVGAHQTVKASPDDGLIVKFDAQGNLLWATYFGGNDHDFVADLAIDPFGDVVMTGHTRSTNGIATDLTLLPGNENAFVTKFTPDGQQLWGTYFGGTYDEGWGIGTDSQGNILVSGETGSVSGISTPGAHQTVKGGGLDAFLVKYDRHGQRLWGTYLGGEGNDRATALVMLPDASVAVVGNTESATGIATPGAHQPQPGSLDDAFTARFAATGSRTWGTYVGGEGVDYLTSITLSADGGILVAGRSESWQQMTSPEAFQSEPAGEYDALLMRYSANGAFEWGTYLGGLATDFANGLAVEPVTGHVILVGMTKSESGVAHGNVTDAQYQGGLYDGFIARFCIPPRPSVSASDGLIVCGDNTLLLSLVPTGLDAQWSTGSSGAQLVFAPPTVGTYELFADVMDANGCPGRSDTVTVQAFDTFEPDALLETDPITCVGVPMTLHLSGTFAAQQWWDGSSGPTAMFTPGDEELHWLHVTVSNDDGCSHTDSLAVQAMLCTGIGRHIPSASPALLPNPSSGIFTVRWPGSEGYPLSISIHSMDGRLVKRLTTTVGAPIHHSLSAGTYLIEATGQEIGTARFPMVICPDAGR